MRILIFSVIVFLCVEAHIPLPEIRSASSRRRIVTFVEAAETSPVPTTTIKRKATATTTEPHSQRFEAVPPAPRRPLSSDASRTPSGRSLTRPSSGSNARSLTSQMMNVSPLVTNPIALPTVGQSVNSFTIDHSSPLLISSPTVLVLRTTDPEILAHISLIDAPHALRFWDLHFLASTPGIPVVVEQGVIRTSSNHDESLQALTGRSYLLLRTRCVSPITEPQKHIETVRLILRRVHAAGYVLGLGSTWESVSSKFLMDRARSRVELIDLSTLRRARRPLEMFHETVILTYLSHTMSS